MCGARVQSINLTNKYYNIHLCKEIGENFYMYVCSTQFK